MVGQHDPYAVILQNIKLMQNFLVTAKFVVDKYFQLYILVSVEEILIYGLRIIFSALDQQY